MTNLSNARVVVFGGGTGSFTLLSALKKHAGHVTAIVNMADDGGSTGVLRDELGVLPPGDVRQCLVALSDRPEVRDLFNYRFAEGRLAGQSLGNIILSGLELQYGSFTEAVRVAGQILHIAGDVIPVTLENHRLVLHDGRMILRGEHKIDEHHIERKTALLSLEPQAVLNPAAGRAIHQADVIVIAPGNMYCSILPIFAVDGIVEALENSSAQKVYVANLVNKPRHTDGWQVVDYVRQIERYLGEGMIDAVLYNTTNAPAELETKYAAAGEVPVGVDLARFTEVRSQMLGCSLMASELVAQDAADKAVKRTLIRHDAERVCQALADYLTAVSAQASPSTVL